MQKVISTLRINEQRMLDLAVSNYSLTTDLADYISQKTKIGYRQVYKIIGQIVDKAIEKGKPLDRITATEIMQAADDLDLKIEVSDEEIAQALDPKLVIAKRNNVGGSSPTVMNKLLDEAGKNIGKQLSRIQQKQTIIKNASQETDRLVKEVIS